jgi:catechol 2,3-dioxygenase
MILRLGHAELRVRDLQAARSFYVDALGFQEAEAAEGRIYLRAAEEFDRWTLALVEAPTPGLGHFALRVDDPQDLERIERLHAERGLPAERVAAGAEPGQGEALRVLTPEGYPVEYYHEMEQIPAHDADGNVRLPMRSAGPSRAGAPLRIDHVNLRSADMQASLDYWTRDLDFSISEYVERDGGVFAAWMRRKTGNHDVALVADSAAALHHVAYFIAEPSSVVALADACADAGFQDAVEFGPGRHGLSNALFLYVRDPSGNRVELYTGDYLRDIDLPAIRWSWDDYDRRGRLYWSPGFPARFMETQALNEAWVNAGARA